MRGVAIAVVLASMAAALDMRTLRTGMIPATVKRGAYYGRTSVPLNASILPLCGNGRIDSKADYTAYYTARGITGPRLLADEACDDGNRLDYDGCSADCVDRDALISPCELQVNWPASSGGMYEALLYKNSGQTMLAVMTKGVYELNPTGEGLDPKLLAGKTFVSTGAHLDDATQTLYVFQAGATPAVHRANLGVAGASFVKVSNFPVQGVQGFALFIPGWSASRQLAVLAASVTGAFLADALTGEQLQQAPNAATAPCSSGFFSSSGTDQSYARLNCGLQMVGFWAQASTQPPRWDPILPAAGPGGGTTWGRFAEAGMVNGMRNNMRTGPSQRRWTYVGGAAPAGDNFVAGDLVGPTFIARILESGRSVYDPLNFDVQLTGSACAYASASHQDDVGECALNVPLNYDVLSATPPPSGGETYADLLQTVAANAASEANLVNNASFIRSFAELAHQRAAQLYPSAVARHGVTLSIWIARGSALFEASTSGAQVQIEQGKCWPTTVGVCPACTWAVAGTGCAECDGAYPAQMAGRLAYAASCAGCNFAFNNRRLLQQQPQLARVEYVLAPPSCVPGVNCTVTVLTADPLAAVRDANELLSAHPEWMVLQRPRLILQAPPVNKSTTTADEGGSSSSNSWIIYAVVGGVVGTAVLVLVIYLFVRRQRQQSYAAVGAPPADA